MWELPAECGFGAYGAGWQITAIIGAAVVVLALILLTISMFTDGDDPPDDDHVDYM